ncbi:hypothetical protein EV189_0834 [Motilibacter rhizosphaerae]|uniref:Uncharacterized protein n=1 Tax=Motilibacter rhizosphaerae TaxID=598652 RepID=A0A4Q7NWK4_9ACTN|nr:hypothetical protein [Motilibacter rhizosphaerae]RZS91587.1 hypothetical protein EV189_0834 [Motilibacter rhizosphaerae]
MASREELLQRLKQGPMFQHWHWLRWNFEQSPATPFATLTLDALLRCEARMEGYADAMLRTLESIGGREYDPDDYERIKQWLGELAVVVHFVDWEWPVPVTFKREPVAPGSGRNPELIVSSETWRFGVEVKTPDLRLLRAGGRQAQPWQLLTRVPGGRDLPGGVTLPRDLAIKDFLHSADAKFAGFHATDAHFYGVLFIVWDDYINEPISALLGGPSGLFTRGNFDLASSGEPHTYPNVDAVVVLRQQHQLQEGMANWPPIDERRHFLDYGDVARFPPNAVIPNPSSTREPPAAVVDALQAYLPGPTMGAEYVPSELVMWLDSRDGDR